MLMAPSSEVIPHSLLRMSLHLASLLFFLLPVYCRYTLSYSSCRERRGGAKSNERPMIMMYHSLYTVGNLYIRVSNIQLRLNNYSISTFLSLLTSWHTGFPKQFFSYLLSFQFKKFGTAFVPFLMDATSIHRS